VPRSIRGRPSGLKAAPHRLRRRPCGPTLTPETSAAPDGRKPRARPRACPQPRTPPGTASRRIWWPRKGSSTGSVATTPWARRSKSFVIMGASPECV